MLAELARSNSARQLSYPRRTLLSVQRRLPHKQYTRNQRPVSIVKRKDKERLFRPTAMASPRAGEWPTQITSELVAGKTIRLGAPAFTLDGDLLWLEARPTEQGRQALVRWHKSSGITDVTPLASGLNVRTRVHEYGGGDYLVGPDFVAFANFSDQRLYLQSMAATGSAAKALSAEGSPQRFADGVFDAKRQRIVAVVEDHSGGEHDVKNFIGAVDLSTGAVTHLVQGADFYASPRLDPTGSKLTWVQWDHPNMPWDDTQIFVADVVADGSLGAPRAVAGGQDSSVQQPTWSPEGELWFVWDRSGWWNLYREKAPGQVEHVLPAEAEFGVPPWLFGSRTYLHLPGNFLLVVVSDPKQAGAQLGLLDLSEASPKLKPLASPYTSIGNITAAQIDGEVVIAVVGGSAKRPLQLATLSAASSQLLLQKGVEDWKVIRSASEDQVEEGFLSEPSAIEFPTAGSKTAFVYYYPPANPEHSLATGELPPLKVLAHGGPTSSASTSLNLSIQFLTSRGFAVADVNYGGSTGYGREYRKRLRGQWGIVDVQDCCAAAEYLVQKGLADPKRLTIAGGSAGGFTCLCSLAFAKVFSAGASYYGVADLALLAKETHKFESRYLDSLVGPYPEDAAIYAERSPSKHAEGLNAPVVFFHGDEDKVVPLSQAEEMHAVLKNKGLPTALVVFAGEQHGFRQSANIQAFLDGELYFFGKVFGFSPVLPDSFTPFDIDNLSAK